MQREELAAARRERVVNQRQWAAYWNAQAAQEAEMRRAMAKPKESGGQRLKKVLFGDLANDPRRL
jgi:hypothetical protein